MRAFLPKAASYGRAGLDGGATVHSVCVVQSRSIGLSRRELLDFALMKPHRVVPAMFTEAVEGPRANQWSREAARSRLARLVYTVEPFRSQTRDFLRATFEGELRECSVLLEDEFWPSDDEGDGDGDDANLKRVADRAAVERVLGAHDHFDVLGLPRDCSAADVKKAFLKLSKAVHPDKNAAPRANEAFDALHTAKQTLSDPDERAVYCTLHPPCAAGAREWAKWMDAHGKTTWQRSTADERPYNRGR